MRSAIRDEVATTPVNSQKYAGFPGMMFPFIGPIRTYGAS
jgi:hypothetical protein